MAKALIKLKFEGLSSEKRPFVAIYGTFTETEKGYEVGSYFIPNTNITSVYEGEVTELAVNVLVIE